MHSYKILFAVFVAIAFSSDAQVYDLKTEYLSSPLGIDNPHPRLTWKLKDPRKGAGQTAYQVWMASDSVAVVNESAKTTWKQFSPENLMVFKEEKLQPFTRYFWKVAIWDKHGGVIKSELV